MEIVPVAAKPAVSPGAAEPFCSLKTKDRNVFLLAFPFPPRLFFFLPPLCGVEPVRLRRGWRGAGAQPGRGLGGAAQVLAGLVGL